MSTHWLAIALFKLSYFADESYLASLDTSLSESSTGKDIPQPALLKKVPVIQEKTGKELRVFPILARMEQLGILCTVRSTLG